MLFLPVFLGLFDPLKRDLNISEGGLHLKYHLTDDKQIRFAVIKIVSKHCKLDGRSFTSAASKLWNAMSFVFTDAKSLDPFKIKLKPRSELA